MINHALLLAALAVSGHRMQPPLSIVFAYNAPQVRPGIPPGNQKVPVKPIAPGIAVPGMKPGQAESYVNISGNFGGVFYVSGSGDSSSVAQSNLINIKTNRGLIFSANSFKPLAIGNSSEPVMGSVTYSMALFQGTSTHVGGLVAGPVSGTDAGFNGQTLALNVAQIPANGNLVLMISRSLTMTGQASGATTLVGTGYISVTIN